MIFLDHASVIKLREDWPLATGKEGYVCNDNYPAYEAKPTRYFFPWFPNGLVLVSGLTCLFQLALPTLI